MTKLDLQNTVENQSDEVSIKDILLKIGRLYKYLLAKWLIIVSFGVLGGFLGFVYAYFKKPIYTATTTFVLDAGDGNNVGLSQYAGLASMVGLDLGASGGGIFQGDNILELYKSRSIIEKALLSPMESDSTVLFVESYIDFNKLRNRWKDNSPLKNVNFKNRKAPDRLQDSLLGTIVDDINKNYLTVSKPDKKLSIIEVNVKSRNEDFAKKFNDQIVKNVNDFYIQTKTKKSLDNVTILRQKVDSVRAVMNGAIYTAAAIADATPNLNPTRQLQRAAPIQRSQVNAETNKAILAELVKNLEISRMGLLKETPLIQVIDSPIYPLHKDKISKLKAVVIGGLLFGVLSVLYLIFKKVLKKIF